MTQYALIATDYDENSKEIKTKIVKISNDLRFVYDRMREIVNERMDYKTNYYYLRIIKFEINFDSLENPLNITSFKTIKECFLTNYK